MGTFALSRVTFSISAAAALLAGCRGPEPPIGAQSLNGIAAQPPSVSSTDGVNAKPTSASGDLLYVTNRLGTVDVFSYPDGALLQTLTGFEDPVGECSDSSGNVYITNSEGQGVMDEYAHGATSPKTVFTGADTGHGCSVDPTTGHVAAASGGDYVAVWESDPNSPTLYRNIGEGMAFCGFDDRGNLFVDSGSDGDVVLYELLAGHSSFVELTVKGVIIGASGQVQWDGKHLTIQDARKPGTIYRFKISGKKAIWVGSTRFSGIEKSLGASWIQGKTVIVPFAARGGGPQQMGYWKYPGGGNATTVLSKFGFPRIFESATISVGS
jgi:hypothetical protein